jgi:ubiquinol-cytochrome c reductase cytochrome c1 subunit
MLKNTMIKAFAVAATLFVGSVSAEEGAGLQNAQTRVGNLASVQSGARLFFNYCSGCHSLKYMSYSQLADDLHLNKDEVLKSFAFTGAKIGDQVLTNMPGDNAKAWFGNTPPDLSLEARAKGPDWIYTYLKSFYLDPSRPTGWNNTVFPSVSMPNVLWELQGPQRAVMAPAKLGEDARVEKLESVSPGKLSAAQFDESARDLTAFLEYAGEPAKVKREAMGVWVVLYLAIFTFLAWLLKHEYWKDVH